MNEVVLIGRLVRDPELRFNSNQTAVARFTLAVDGPVRQDGEKHTDFIRVTAFGKQAENIERYIKKGRQIAVKGHIQTGSYQGKDGQMVYTTDVISDKTEFLGDRPQEQTRPMPRDVRDIEERIRKMQEEIAMPDQFQAAEEDIPF